jgi:hypothetical protein
MVTSVGAVAGREPDLVRAAGRVGAVHEGEQDGRRRETQRRGAAGMGGRTMETSNAWIPAEQCRAAHARVEARRTCSSSSGSRRRTCRTGTSGSGGRSTRSSTRGPRGSISTRSRLRLRSCCRGSGAGGAVLREPDRPGRVRGWTMVRSRPGRQVASRDRPVPSGADLSRVRRVRRRRLDGDPGGDPRFPPVHADRCATAGRRSGIRRRPVGGCPGRTSWPRSTSPLPTFEVVRAYCDPPGWESQITTCREVRRRPRDRVADVPAYADARGARAVPDRPHRPVVRADARRRRARRSTSRTRSSGREPRRRTSSGSRRRRRRSTSRCRGPRARGVSDAIAAGRPLSRPSSEVLVFGW